MFDSMHFNSCSFNNGSNVRLLSGNETESVPEGSGTQSRMGSSYTGVKNTSDSMERGVSKRNSGFFTLKNVCIAAGVTVAFGAGALTGFAVAGGFASACAYRGRNNNASTTSPQSLPQNMPLKCYSSLCKDPDSKIDVIPAPITRNGTLIFSGCNKPNSKEPQVGRHLLNIYALEAECEGNQICWNALDKRFDKIIPKPEDVGLVITLEDDWRKRPDILTFSDVSAKLDASLEHKRGVCINPGTVLLRTKQFDAVVQAYLKFDLSDDDLNEILEDVQQKIIEVNDLVADLEKRQYRKKTEMLASLKEAYTELKNIYNKTSNGYEADEKRCF